MKQFIKPEEVVAVLNAAEVTYVLVGAHGLMGWTGVSRATEDVDVVIAKRHHKRALKALLKAYPHLSPEDNLVVTRLRDPESKKVVVDLMKPTQPVIRAALRNTHEVTEGGQVYRVPTVEMALAMKFAPMTSLNRVLDKKYQDAADFVRVVSANTKLDFRKLRRLGDTVYADGGTELLEMVRRVRAGERPEF